ncbi:hypothetical protein PU560_05040 [Georgenia sp. 10Sc9-8]|uniref:Uncharacterized protein n=1 Tax=Georgenia halotolerans TaxID=3028317 RepID=A0ABT5TUU0_9MICO|nr:hypothetical protein [Georgenia halotolerans]
MRSEPLDGGRLYSVLTATDVLTTSGVREHHASDVGEVLSIVAAFLTETDTRGGAGDHHARTAP